MRKAVELIRRRHPEWREHQQRWQWLLDSLEGGERYRQAVYGYDRRGLPVRNLARHKREYPDPRDVAATAAAVGCAGVTPPATDDDYELRRTRTPSPTFVAEAIETHLSRIYARQVHREGPEPLKKFWADVDGVGTPISHWMAETVAPLLLVLGQLDLRVDLPALPPGESVETRADQLRLGLDRCLASVILPEDLLWWRLDATGQRYEECLVHEPVETEDGTRESRYRHWTTLGSTLYSDRGEVLAETPHAYGRVPIVRVFDRRKPRCRNVGQSRYEGVAERQREYYNRDSELILADTTQAHPLLQGPEDYVQPDGTIPVGPSWLLPKKRNAMASTVSYEGFDVVAFPQAGADSLRQNKEDLREEVDRDAALTRPHGAALSGLAKMLDHYDGNNRLAKIARVLARAEAALAELVLVVLGSGELESQASTTTTPPVQIVYPTDFDLFSASDVAAAAAQFQAIVARSGALPNVESLLLSRLLRLCLPGLADDVYARCDTELEAYLADQDSRRQILPKVDTGPPGKETTVYADVHRWQSQV